MSDCELTEGALAAEAAVRRVGSFMAADSVASERLKELEVPTWCLEVGICSCKTTRRRREGGHIDVLRFDRDKQLCVKYRADTQKLVEIP